MPSNTPPRGPHTKKGPENAAERRMKRNPIFWVFSVVILVLIVVAFVAGPALTGLGQPQDSIRFGTYDGEPIEFKPNNYFHQQYQNIAQQWDQEITSEQDVQWQMFQIWYNAFQNTVIYMDLKQRAERAGLSVTDERVQNYLLTSGPYINEQGEFDRRRYNETPATQRQQIMNQVRDQLLVQQVSSDLFGAKVPSGEAEFVFSLGRTEKAFDYVAFSLEDYPLDRTADYAADNQDRFRIIDVSSISLIEDRSQAESVRRRIADGEITFEEAARTYSQDIFAEDGGTAGRYYYFELLEEFEDREQLDALFSLQESEISEVVETDYGFAIYRVNTPAQLADLEDEDTLQEIRQYMARTARGAIEDYFTDHARSFTADAEAQGFTEAAQEAGLTVYSTDSFPLNYGGSMFLGRISQADDGGILEGISNNEYALQSLFSVDQGEITQPITVGNNIAVAVCREVVTISEADLSRLSMIYPYYIGEIQQEEFTRSVLTSDKLEENFMNVFVGQILQ